MPPVRSLLGLTGTVGKINLSKNALSDKLSKSYQLV